MGRWTWKLSFVLTKVIHETKKILILSLTCQRLNLFSSPLCLTCKGSDDLINSFLSLLSLTYKLASLSLTCNNNPFLKISTFPLLRILRLIVVLKLIIKKVVFQPQFVIRQFFFFKF